MSRTLADFAGDWRIDRRIEDRQNAGLSHLSGRATFAEDNQRMVLSESGQLTIPDGRQITATRRYLWCAVANGIAVRFDDGSPFHVFDPSQARSCARHTCAPDLYVVRYTFADWPAWRMSWTVSGPRKDYTSVTCFTR